MKKLIIVGAGIYGAVAAEIAKSMGIYEKIAYVDDNATTTVTSCEVIGRFDDLPSLRSEYDSIVIAIGNPHVRASMIERLEREGIFEPDTLVSPYAYVSPSAKLGKGCIIEPMAVVHSLCKLGDGCIISAGAILNHSSVCENYVHVDCNATVSGFATVPSKTKVVAGSLVDGEA